ILWFRKVDRALEAPSLPAVADVPAEDLNSDVLTQYAREYGSGEWFLASQTYWQLGRSIRCADALLHQAGDDVAAWINILREEVGPRQTRDGSDLKNLTIGEFDTAQLLAAPAPLSSSVIALANATVLPGNDLKAQAEWLQLRYGSLSAQVGPLRLRER
ncbi:hypothetical protein ACFL2V_17820, partial [Pseudomonadota bacterium]